jgi:hypothetical protein
LYCESEVTGASANYEFSRAGFSKYPLPTGGSISMPYFVAWGRGYDTGIRLQPQLFTMEIVYRGPDLTAQDGNITSIILENECTDAYWLHTSASVGASFDSIETKLKLDGVTRGIGCTGLTVTTPQITGSADLAITLLAFPVSDATNTFQFTVRHLRLDAKLK